MQNSMKESKPLFVMIPVPLEAIEESGIAPGDLIQITASDGRITIEAVTDSEDFVCDGDCENCPVNMTECNDDCVRCPCHNTCEDCEVEN